MILKFYIMRSRGRRRSWRDIMIGPAYVGDLPTVTQARGDSIYTQAFLVSTGALAQTYPPSMNRCWSPSRRWCCTPWVRAHEGTRGLLQRGPEMVLRRAVVRPDQPGCRVSDTIFAWVDVRQLPLTFVMHNCSHYKGIYHLSLPLLPCFHRHLVGCSSYLQWSEPNFRSTPSARGSLRDPRFRKHDASFMSGTPNTVANARI